MWVEIEFGKYYTVKETAEILSLNRPIITKKCREWVIECSNIGSEIRANYRIKWEAILNFLTK